MKIVSRFLLAAGLTCAMATAAAAQGSISFGEAAALWSKACRADVEAHCSTVNPGSGELVGCLREKASPVCNTATVAFGVNLRARFAAQAKAADICRSDVERFCSNFNPGSARILRCLMQPANFKAASVPCKDTLAAAGWLDQISIRTAYPDPQVARSIDQLSKSVKTVEIDVAAVRQDILVRIKEENTPDAAAAAEELNVLKQLPNFTVQVDFFLDSTIVKPDFWVTVGRLADALHHPLLSGDGFLVVGHTDTTGTREHNLGLSDRRAAAILKILETTFEVPPSRLVPLGVGEEQLLDGIPPTDPRNRRVQLINLGPQ